MAYTVFLTYLLAPYSGHTTGYGYSDAIHCNYINSIVVDTISNKDVNIYFNNANDFKYLSTSGGTGYSATDIFALVQLIDNTLVTDSNNIKPNPANWRMYNVTNQITGNTSPSVFLLNPENITTTVFRIPLYLYNTMKSYDLSYINYPTKLIADDDKLCFGDEDYFMGNVSTDIEAIAYSTDLAINLPLNEFNSTSNATWDGVSNVFISEIGIYDANKNLIGIGKLNNPIDKNATISRTIVFGIDF